MGNPHQHPQGQPPRRAQLAGGNEYQTSRLSAYWISVSAMIGSTSAISLWCSSELVQRSNWSWLSKWTRVTYLGVSASSVRIVSMLKKPSAPSSWALAFFTQSSKAWADTLCHHKRGPTVTALSGGLYIVRHRLYSCSDQQNIPTPAHISILHRGPPRPEAWVVSDHACCRPELKLHAQNPDDIFLAKAGFGGTEYLLSGVFTEGTKLGLSYSRIAELLSWNPAQRFGLLSKGTIDVGYDADVAIVDANETYTVQAAESESTQGYTPFEGHELTGRVKHAFLGGRQILDSGKVVGPPTGRYLARPT